jgi:hypothetical protein
MRWRRRQQPDDRCTLDPRAEIVHNKKRVAGVEPA